MDSAASRRHAARESTGPLAGLSVVDLTQMLAGPFCTMLLADLGADVLKVEPLEGDRVRAEGPFPRGDEVRAYGGFFQSINRNKRSIALDLRSAEGREVVLRLVRDADVVVENYRAGVMERLGFAYETLHGLNPRLVYACIRGFGDPRTGESPYVGWQAFDIVAQAMGGIMSMTGPPGQPTKVGPAAGDIVPGMFAALGILAALRHADRTGQGQLVDVAMYDSVLALCERIVFRHSYIGEVASPQGNSHPFLCPFDVFAAADGAVVIAAPFDHIWRELCAAIGRPELADDPRFASNRARSANCAEVRALLAAWTGPRTRAEIVAVLGGHVPCGPVNGVEEIVSDPHIAVRAMLATVEHPGAPQPVTIVASPIKLTETPAAVRTRAPLLGEHTDDVLASLGYSAAEVGALRERGLVR